MRISRRVGRHTVFATLTCVTLIAVAVTGSEAAAEENGLARFAGEFRWSGDESERDGIAAAIETAVEPINFLMRGAVRSRLSEASNVVPELEIRVSDESIFFKFGDREPVRARADGEPVSFLNPFGDTVEIACQLKEGALVQSVGNADGGRTAVFRLLDGARLAVQMTTTSRFLPVPLSYGLTYSRRAP